MSDWTEDTPDAKADDEQVCNQESALEISRDQAADEARWRK